MDYLREVAHHLKQYIPDFEKRFLKKKPIDESGNIYL